MPLLVADIDWNTLLQKPDVLPLLVGFGTMGIVALTAIIAVQWRKAQQAKYDAHLKEHLIARGFSAEEIISVVNAGRGRARVGKMVRREDCCEPFVS